jgi:hypothetical protein
VIRTAAALLVVAPAAASGAASTARMRCLAGTGFAHRGPYGWAEQTDLFVPRAR